MQRILYVTDSLTAGGVERQLTELVTRLDRQQFASLVVSLYGDRAGLHPHFAAPIEAAGIPLRVLDLGWGAADKLRAVGQLTAIVRKFQPDRVHTFNYHSNLLLRLARPLFPRQTRLIGSVRGNYTAKQLTYERFSQWACARIVTNGPQLRQQLISRANIPARKIVYIPNGVDVEYFSRYHDSASVTPDSPDSGRYFLSVGRLSHEKLMHYLPEALGRLKSAGRLPADTRLLIIGPSDNAAMYEQLMTSIARHGLQTVVQYLPETHDLAPYYQRCQVSILFSPAEGMPNVVLESLASGRPVVISAGANAAGIIETGKTGWVVPTGDIAQLAETLHRLIVCPSGTLQAMAADCQARADQFSMARMVAACEQLYTTVL